VLVEVGQQAAQVIANQIDLQRPRRVRVADGEGEVRHSGEHQALVGQAAGQVHRRAVDREGDAAEGEQLQPGGGDDDVGGQLAARLQQDAVLGEPDDPVGDHRRLTLPDGPEQVGVGHRAHPLVPRVVGRVEMGVDVVALG